MVFCLYVSVPLVHSFMIAFGVVANLLFGRMEAENRDWERQFANFLHLEHRVRKKKGYVLTERTAQEGHREKA